MKQISKEKLKTVVELHKVWRKDNKEGKRLVLIGYDLSYRDLNDSDLSYCDLSHSCLSHCDMYHCDLSHSCLSDCNMSHSDLSHSDLSDCNMTGCNMDGCNMDSSGVNLSCTDLGIHLDDRLIIQRLYHTLFNAQYSKNVSLDLKTALLTPELVEVANRFHRVAECGEIEKEEI